MQKMQKGKCPELNLCQWMMSWEMYMGILWVHKAQGPEIMALWLQDMYIVLTDKNVNDICNVMRKQVARMLLGCPTGGSKSQ